MQWTTVFPGKSVRGGNGRILRTDFGAHHSLDIGSADLHQAIVNLVDGLQALRADRTSHAELVHGGIATGIKVSDGDVDYRDGYTYFLLSLLLCIVDGTYKSQR